MGHRFRIPNGRRVTRRIRPSPAQQELQDDAGGDRDQNVVAAGLNPMVTARRSAQAVTAPVIDHVIVVAGLDRKGPATVKRMVRACATFIVPLITSRAASVIVSTRAVIAATILVVTRLCASPAIVAATAIAVVPTTLSERNASLGQRHRD